MESDKQEEQKPVKIEFIEDYSENRSDPDEGLKRQNNRQVSVYSCLFINDAVRYLSYKSLAVL